MTEFMTDTFVDLAMRVAELEQALFTEKDAWLREFAAHCITIGQDVKLVRGDDVCVGGNGPPRQ